MFGDDRRQCVVNEDANPVGDVITLENLPAVTINCLSLTVQNIVILENVLANFSIACFDLTLRRLYCSAHDARFDGNIFLIGAGSSHQSFRGSGIEHSHQVVLEREIKTAFSGITLSTRAPTKLVVDTSRLVALRSQNIQTAEVTNSFRLLLNLIHHGLEYRVPG